MFHVANVLEEKSRSSGEVEREKSVRRPGSETQRHLDKRKAYTIVEGFRREGRNKRRRIQLKEELLILRGPG